MSKRLKQYSLLAIVIVLGLFTVAVVNAQMSAVRRWNPRRVPVDTVFVGDQACGECHKMFRADMRKDG